MQPLALSALLGAAAVAALVDAVAVRRAWAAPNERAAIWLAGLAALFTAASTAWLWLAAAQRLRAHPRLHRAVAWAPACAILGLVGGATATAHRLAGPAAPLAIGLVLLGAAALIATPRPPRWLAAIAGAAALIVDATLSRRLHPSLRVTLLIGGVAALAIALDDRVVRRFAPILAAAVVAAGAIATVGLLGVSPNVRFVAAVQAPATSLLLEGIAALRPAPSALAEPTARAARSSAGEGAATPVFADADLVLITVDALRADRPLPETERRSPDALRFTHAYAQAPRTAWSISSLLTGAPPDELARRPPTLADTLRAARWYTAAFYPAGLFFDGRGALEPYAAARFGFEQTDTRTLDARALTDAVLTELERLRAGDPRTFLWVHYFDPHEPYEAHDGIAADAPAAVRYAGEVARVDRELARLLDQLARRARPAIVALTGDHGEELGEHGGAYHGTSLYDEQLRVPLRVWVVGAPFASRTIDAPVELTAVAPALLALAGVTAPAATLFDDTPRDVHAQLDARRMLLRGHDKLVYDPRGDVTELYDLVVDPGEQRNLAGSAPERAAALLASLRSWSGLAPPATLRATLADRARPSTERAAAARALGELGTRDAAPALTHALADPDRVVAAEAALALAELADAAARPPLRALLDDPAWRRRAALGLGHLRDPAAAPALVEATRDIDVTARRHAVHYLGFVGDATVIPILEDRARDDLKVRDDAYLALGRLAARTGAASAIAFLVARLASEPQADARAQLAWGLGLAGEAHPALVDARARALLRRAAAEDPPLPNASEALVRLGDFSGVDFAPGLRGFADCRRREVEPRFTDATVCAQPARTVVLPIERPADATLLLLRGRSPAATPVRERISVEGRVVAEVTLPPAFVERRVSLPPGRVRSVTLEALSDGPLPELDHLLLLPGP